MMHKLILTENTELKEAILLLDKNGNGFLPVVDYDGKLLGILTDGDIRRAILNNETKVKSIYNPHPIVASDKEPRQSIIRRLHELKRRQMPIVNDDGIYLDAVILNDFNTKRNDHTVVIMAGGLGSRLGDLTKNLPKPMLPIKGKPILEEILNRFKIAGFYKFILCLNYKADVIQNYFGNGEKFDCEINYTVESKRLGTAGALSIINQELITNSFLVTNGDVITNCNYEDFLDFHLRNNAVATMCIRQHPFQIPFATVEVDEQSRLIQIKEKPVLPFFINTGIYCLTKEVIKQLPTNEYFDMPNLFLLLNELSKKILTYKIEDDWVDVGSPFDYNEVNKIF